MSQQNLMAPPMRTFPQSRTSEGTSRAMMIEVAEKSFLDVSFVMAPCSFLSRYELTVFKKELMPPTATRLTLPVSITNLFPDT